MKIEDVNSYKKVTEEIITIDEDFYNDDAIDNNKRYVQFILCIQLYTGID